LFIHRNYLAPVISYLDRVRWRAVYDCGALAECSYQQNVHIHIVPYSYIWLVR